MAVLSDWVGRYKTGRIREATTGAYSVLHGSFLGTRTIDSAFRMRFGSKIPQATKGRRYGERGGVGEGEGEGEGRNGAGGGGFRPRVSGTLGTSGTSGT